MLPADRLSTQFRRGQFIFKLDDGYFAASAKRTEARIRCIDADITRGLPPDIGRFDAIFAMQSFHSFGTRRGILKYLTGLLNPGGRISIGQTCFRHEPKSLAGVFLDTGGYDAEYRKYHSPAWWRDMFAASGELDVECAQEVTEGAVMWEDHVLYHGDKEGWSVNFMHRHSWLMQQILAGRHEPPVLTHFLLTARKCGPASELRPPPGRSTHFCTRSSLIDPPKERVV